MNKGLGILPCAGLGTRMQMHANESKELLIDPVTNEPLIAWHIKYCKNNNLKPLVVTREEKQDLIGYCKTMGVETLIIKPRGEWANTIHATYNHWTDFNVILFPDAKFDDAQFISKARTIFETQQAKQIIYGVQEVDDITKWCIIDNYNVYEKPQNIKRDKALAVCVFAFNKQLPNYYFKFLDENKFVGSQVNNILFINKFVDLTRTGKIEHVDL